MISFYGWQRKIIAVRNAINSGNEKAGAVAIFEHSTDTYVYIQDGQNNTGMTSNDILIKLSEFDLDGKTPAIDGQYLTILQTYYTFNNFTKNKILKIKNIILLKTI